ncbi:peptidase associated/transthyretin-like domain-containing protein [Tuwongella immobilis]|uniref:Carboxypeptidase regulatory-like domain-containing protein n=1 Tax=Tuwongella immobilis TaxID=692036 RepID=A0A6C2YL23_9BACT|nr:carboxypeptidase-like regulatory domain-containing protein [Tuwongella immobilis]VIP01929.1 Uncharacterized protein OS=Planctomyces limnophilus (strain ATCC 43296 / DSM 3776 / IFAM 1008 / 290) GN=Plim_3310 PE=4 SV=1 [Tuwongella immobilis]VTR99875.1 Uncharacterized protein OS=Planctomyces limnophilus (strain ATCC 43296 / DSM 3776 / IFAM 1008 / 290) GN=Plim_3310 PE=4 SV=1 [Tuwongella immobilis]
MRRTVRLLGVWTLGLAMLSLGCNRGGSNGVAIVTEPEASGPVLTPVEAKGYGTITGVVTFDGTPPLMKPIAMGDHPHAPHCQSKDLMDESWVVNPTNRGVANVVVWVKPPKGSFFPLPPDAQKTWTDEVHMDQPKCAFTPRVVTMFPEYYDAQANKLRSTSQLLVIRNDSPVVHSAEILGSIAQNSSQITTIPAKVPGGKPSEQAFRLKSDRNVMTVNCSLHRWMRGFVWAFDHPYSAVTDANGRFEIKHVPAGSELTFSVWHEQGQLSVPKTGQPITVPADGTLNLPLTIQMPAPLPTPPMPMLDPAGSPDAKSK